VEPTVSRRGTCDRGICTKPLARRTRADHIFINGYSMAVSLFDRLRSGRNRIDEKLMSSTASSIITQKAKLLHLKNKCR
jgi:hypothetical protein